MRPVQFIPMTKHLVPFLWWSLLIVVVVVLVAALLKVNVELAVRLCVCRRWPVARNVVRNSPFDSRFP